MDSAIINMGHLYFTYWPINIKRPMMMYSDIQYRRLQNLLWTLVQQLFKLTSKPPYTTLWTSCEVKSYRLHLGQSWWRTVQSLGFSKQCGKKDSEVPVLEENIRTVVFTTSRSQRLLWVWLYIHSSERQASGTVLRLPARKLYWCR